MSQPVFNKPSLYEPVTSGERALFPLGAMMLAASVGSWARSALEQKALPAVIVREKAEAPQGKDVLQTKKSTIGKGNQDIRDIPQSIVAGIMVEYKFTPDVYDQLNVNNVTNNAYGDQLYPGFTILGPKRLALATLGVRF